MLTQEQLREEQEKRRQEQIKEEEKEKQKLDLRLKIDHNVSAMTCSIPFKDAGLFLFFLKKIHNNAVIPKRGLRRLVDLMSHYSTFFGAKDVSYHYSSALQSLADPVPLTSEMKNETWWWETKIREFMEKPCTKYLDLREVVEVYSDASGEWKNPACGIGAMICSHPAVYVTHPWPEVFRNNIPLKNGEQLRDNIVLMEAIGVIFSVCANPE